jgi:hypothetical protein
MNVLILDFFAETAERELAERLKLACKNLGWHAQFGSWQSDSGAQPDFALALHQINPRAFDIPTFGCIWNPPGFYENSVPHKANLLSYDGYLFAGSQIRQWFDDLLFSVYPKIYEVGEILPSVHDFILPPASSTASPKVAYCGTNWDRSRHQELIAKLDARGIATFIGPPGAWSHLKNSVERRIPFDGESMVRELANYPAVLCLTSETHKKWGIPTMRIFETIAAGVMPICDRNSFFLENFPEALFLTDGLSPAAQVDEIAGHLDWIQKNSEAMKLKIEAMQARLRSQFILERFLEPLAEKVARARVKKFLSISPESSKKIQIVLRYGKQPPSVLAKTLEHVVHQTYKNIEIIAVRVKKNPESEQLLKSFNNRLSIQQVDMENGDEVSPSTALWKVLATLSFDYFAVLVEGDCWATNHIAILIDTFDKIPGIGVAHSGRVTTERVMQPDGALGFGSIYGLSHIGNRLTLDQCDEIPESAFLARRSLLTSYELIDPAVGAYEVFYLLALLSRKCEFSLTGEATMTSGANRGDTAKARRSALNRVSFRLYGQVFEILPSPTGMSLEDRVLVLKMANVGLNVLRKTGVLKLLKMIRRFF